jgi:hypothetical protein
MKLAQIHNHQTQLNVRETTTHVTESGKPVEC